MTSLRQIHANRCNARLSTGPVTEKRKRKSRRNAVRRGLTAETVIDVLEDAEDYAAFELSVTADYDVRSAVERELVLRWASLLWRLRRATAIESGLFKIHALHLLQFQRRRQASQKTFDEMNRFSLAPRESEGRLENEHFPFPRSDSVTNNASDGQQDDLTQSFVRLSNLSTYPLDRLSRYEATLWRQACQTLFSLNCLNKRESRGRFRIR
jgi:hypothetical protein